MKTKLLKRIMTFVLFSAFFLPIMAQNIYTFVQLSDPRGVAIDSTGCLYIANRFGQQILKVNPVGNISIIAGTGSWGFSGDGGAATSAKLYNPSGVAVDASGNVYIADDSNNRVRKINPSGVISTFAGTGVAGFSGDGGAASSAQLNGPTGVVVDALGNLFIAERYNHVIRKVNPSGIISTFAGTGTSGFNGDGGAATNAQLFNPSGLAFDLLGNLYIADISCRIRKVNTAGIISTFAGTGIQGYSGDGGAATSAQLGSSCGVAVDASGNVYIAENGNQLIRKVNTAGIISTFAGTGTCNFSGDWGPAISAQLCNPTGIAIDTSGNVYIADNNNQRVREICITGCLANINSLTEDNNKIFVYPNPNSGSFKLNGEISNGEIFLFNSLGQKVLDQKILQGENNIITIGFAKGIYHYVVFQNKQLASFGKLAIE